MPIVLRSTSEMLSSMLPFTELLRRQATTSGASVVVEAHNDTSSELKSASLEGKLFKSVRGLVGGGAEEVASTTAMGVNGGVRGSARAPSRPGLLGLQKAEGAWNELSNEFSFSGQRFCGVSPLPNVTQSLS